MAAWTAAEVGRLRAGHAIGWRLDFNWSVLLDQESSPISVRRDPARGIFRYFSAGLAGFGNVCSFSRAFAHARLEIDRFVSQFNGRTACLSGTDRQARSVMGTSD